MTPLIGHLTDSITHLEGRIGEAFAEALLRRAKVFQALSGAGVNLEK